MEKPRPTVEPRYRGNALHDLPSHPRQAEYTARAILVEPASIEQDVGPLASRQDPQSGLADAPTLDSMRLGLRSAARERKRVATRGKATL